MGNEGDKEYDSFLAHKKKSKKAALWRKRRLDAGINTAFYVKFPSSPPTAEHSPRRGKVLNAAKQMRGKIEVEEPENP